MDLAGQRAVVIPGHATTAEPGGEPAFLWKDHSRFVELHPVQTGWLVVWGRYEELGRRKILLGNRTYRDIGGARRRLADAVLELTRKPALAAEALTLLDRSPLPPHRSEPLPDSL